MAKDHPTGQSGLYQAFLQLKTPEQCYRFLQDVCSYSELSAMEQRYNIAEMLVDKRIYTEIMDEDRCIQRHHQPGKPGAECQRQRIARLAGSGKSCRRSKRGLSTQTMPRAARAVCGFYHSTGKAEVPTPAGYFYRFSSCGADAPSSSEIREV